MGLLGTGFAYKKAEFAQGRAGWLPVEEAIRA